MFAYIVSYAFLKEGSSNGPVLSRGQLVVEAKGESEASKIASEKLKAYGPTVRIKSVKPW